MDFSVFKHAFERHIDAMLLTGKRLYLTDVSKDDIWAKYLESFPEGTNPIYKERTEYDCVCCRQFLRPYGNIVMINNNELISIWDIDFKGEHKAYQAVADGLSKFVKSQPIRDIFVSKFDKLGVNANHQRLESGEVIKWQHFYYKLLPKYVDKSSYSVEAVAGEARTTKEVFQRGLKEITLEAIDTVIELIEQNSLYRGDEQLPIVKDFKLNKVAYSKLVEQDKDNFTWSRSHKLSARIRNTAIGTLLVDLSDSKPVDIAVTAFEKIMAPANYKRPKAIYTKRMIEEAREKVAELGMENSLERRFSTIDDVTINNVLFANRDSKASMDVFDKMQEGVNVDKKSFSKIEEVKLDTFINDVLPKTTSIKVLFENKHVNNLMSLISPVDISAPSMFKWNNNFSWVYNGNVTDSIKERVKKAGGNVEGFLRCSLSWFNGDDLDIHMLEPNGSHIYYSNKISSTGGRLDVDMNAGGKTNTKDPVENITWGNKHTLRQGNYKLYVNNYQKRSVSNTGFEVEVDLGGDVHHFSHPEDLKNQRSIVVLEFSYSKANGFKIIKSISEEPINREEWGITTNKFLETSLVTVSPNYWDDNKVGNKHYFFILKDCVNPDTANPFFNEYLKQELVVHKRVFEALGGLMQVKQSEVQLSGLGFSTTQKNNIICKVEGSFTRTIKVII